MKQRDTVDLRNTERCSLVERDSKVPKTQAIQRENVNYLWRIGLLEGVRQCAENGEDNTSSLLSQDALRRIKTVNESVHKDHLLFCKQCATIFLPGDTCTVRVMSNSRKSRKLRKKSGKGIIYTCKMCGFHQKKEMERRSLNENSDKRNVGNKRKR